MSRRRALVIACLCVLPLTGTRAQQASISGIVSDDSDQPIVRAVVTLSGSALKPSLVAIADAAGRFSFSGVPAGIFTLSAAKPTYLTMAFGQTTPGRGSGVPISIREGQQLSGLTWKLPRGGVVSGRVLDDRAQPMRDVPIVLMQYRTTNNERTLGSVTCCVWPVTDSDGTYRVYGVLPGDYLVSAIPPGSYVFIPTGPWSASGSEVRQIEPGEMQWALQQIAATGPAASRAPLAPEPPAGPSVAYGRMYFPGTPDETAATTVTIGRGEERRGVDFAMRLQRAARLEGRVVGPDGQAAINPRISMGGATVGSSNPAFSYRGLLPGRYVITARTAMPPLWGTMDVDVNGQDLLGLELRLEPSPTIAGRIAFESSAGLAPPADLSSVRISLRPLSPGSLPINAAADGSFKMPGVDPGRYRMFATLAAPAGTPAAAASPGWVLKSALLGGRDVTDVPFEIKPGEHVSDVVVTFSDRVTELSGTLRDAGGQIAPGYYVVVFSTDAAFWSQGSRRVPAPVRAATNGSFRFAGLPPGTYYVAALTNVDQADLADTAFLKQISSTALTVTLADGEKKVQDLGFTGGRGGGAPGGAGRHILRP